MQNQIFSKVRSRLKSLKIPILILLTGILLTSILSWKARKDALEQLRQQFVIDAETRSLIIEHALGDHIIDLEGLRNFFNITPVVSRQAFTAFVAPTLKTRPGIQAFEWIPRVAYPERALFEAEARRDGLPDYQIYQLDPKGHKVSAGPRQYYYPVAYVEPLAGNEPAVGFDLGSDPARLDALDNATDTGRAAATERLTLVQETGAQAGFLITIPVYRPKLPLTTVAQRRLALQGFVLGVLRFGDAAEDAVQPAPEKGLWTTLFDLSAPQDKQLLQRFVGPSRHLEAVSWRTLLTPSVTPSYKHYFIFAGRQWLVEISASPAYVQRHISLSYWLIPPIGVLVTLLLMLYFRALLSHKVAAYAAARDITERQRAEEASSKHHRELQETARRLEQSVHLLQLIIESIPARVFWKDADLRYLGCNTQFARDAGLEHPQQLLGKDDFAMGWKDQADLYRADDRQVMESSRPKLNIIEPQTTPGGAQIWLNTSKVPLQHPDGEVFGVLGVYQDVTEHKRAEAEIKLNEARLSSLLRIFQNQAASIQDLLDYALDEVIALTGSKIGYLYFYDEATRQFTLNTWSKGVMPACAIPEPQTIYQLDQTGLWGEAVRQARPIMVNDFQAPHPLKKGCPPGHAPLTKYLTHPGGQRREDRGRRGRGQ